MKNILITGANRGSGLGATDMTNQTCLINIKTSLAGLSPVINNATSYQLEAFVAFDSTELPY